MNIPGMMSAVRTAGLQTAKALAPLAKQTGMALATEVLNQAASATAPSGVPAQPSLRNALALKLLSRCQAHKDAAGVDGAAPQAGMPSQAAIKAAVGAIRQAIGALFKSARKPAATTPAAPEGALQHAADQLDKPSAKPTAEPAGKGSAAPPDKDEMMSRLGTLRHAADDYFAAQQQPGATDAELAAKRSALKQLIDDLEKLFEKSPT